MLARLKRTQMEKTDLLFVNLCGRHEVLVVVACLGVNPPKLAFSQIQLHPAQSISFILSNISPSSYGVHKIDLLFSDIFDH